MEALLLVAVEPVSVTELAQSVGVPEPEIADALVELTAFYDETGRGFELRELGGGWRYYTREEHADLISRHVLEGQQPGCPRRRWRPWPWWRTASRSPAAGCRPYAG